MVEPMAVHSSWPCGTAGEWSVLTSFFGRFLQPDVMESPKVVVGYDRVLTPALSRIETSRNRAWQRQRPNWRACLPTASAFAAHLMGLAFWRPERPEDDETATGRPRTIGRGPRDGHVAKRTTSRALGAADIWPGTCGRTHQSVHAISPGREKG